MKKIHITYKAFFITAVLGSLIIMFMVVANSLYTSRQTLSATDEAVSEVSSFYLEAMADRRAKTITNLINNSFEQMDKALTFIEDEGIESQEALREAIGKIKSLLSLNRFALVDEDDIVYTQYTTYTGGSRHEFLSEEQMDARVIRTVSPYGSSTQLLLAIPTPELTILGKPIKACFVQIDISDIVDLLAFDDKGRTYFALYTSSGENLSDTELGPFVSGQNLFSATKGVVPEAVWNENRDRFASLTEGSMSFASEGADETLFYVPIQGTDWEMAVLIRESVINDRIHDISDKSLTSTRRQIVFTLVSVLLLSALLLFQLIRLAKDRLEAEQQTSKAFQSMANTDSLTGIKNKLAYSESEAAVNRQIQNGELQSLAVVVCDVNGLKHVNDTLGHAAGDVLIKDACAMICEYFSHGSVFRIGGDEFAVLLRDRGFEEMQESVVAFNRRVEANIDTDAVVVSIGYAALEPEDRQLRDVFERADKMMYERKQQLKAMGARTRE